MGLLVAKTLTNATANPFLAGGAGSYNPVLALDVFLVQASVQHVLECHAPTHALSVQPLTAGVHQHAAGALCVADLLAVHHPNSQPEPACAPRVPGRCPRSGLMLCCDKPLLHCL